MQKGADYPLLHLVCIYDYIIVLRFCVGFVLELPSNFSGDFLLESSKVPTTGLSAAGKSPFPSSPAAMPPAPHSVANATSLPGRGESVQGDGFWRWRESFRHSAKASPWGSWRAAPEGVGLAAYNTKKRPALPVEMRGAWVTRACNPYAFGWGCAAEDWAAMNSAASSGMSSRSSSLPMSTLSGGFLNRISYRIGTIYRVIRVA